MRSHHSTEPAGKTIVLIPGAGHGIWCWQKIIPLLEAAGHTVLSTALPGTNANPENLEKISLEDDVATVMELIQTAGGKVILAGHSSGGIIISQTAEYLGPDKTEKLIYLDAFLPQNGESVISLATKIDQLNQANGSRNYINIGPERFIFSNNQQVFKWNPSLTAELFYHDCSTEDIRLANKSLVWNSMATIASPVKLSDKAFGAIKKYYILCTEARDLDKSRMTDNVPCEKVYRLASSHSPYLSIPEELSAIISEIANIP